MELQTFWHEVMAKLGSRLSESDLSCWISTIRPLELRDGSFRGEVPSRIHLERVRVRFAQEISRALEEVAGPGCELVFSINPACATIAPAKRPVNSRLSSAYTFETFVTGPSNWMAYQSAHEVAGRPGARFNPLYLYGGVGLGKTHLATAVANQLLRSFPRPKITLLSAEMFTNDLIRSYRNGSVETFRQRLRHADVLIVDDIQFLAGKDRMQEEFFHTFNALHGAQKQIVLASDQPPRDIPNLEERLRSRFESGLLINILRPELSLRLAILAKKAVSMGLALPVDVAQLIATRIVSNVRELEGALHRLAAACQFGKRSLSLEFATEILRPILRMPPPRTLDQVQRLVAEQFRVSEQDLIQRGRARRLHLPRQVAMYLARRGTKATYAEIAAGFGGRDHSTVMHAVKSVEERRTSEPEFAAMLDHLEVQLQQA